jgi:carboxypeptidase C (cathepsin A)
MYYNEYIKIKNIANICGFYGETFLSNNSGMDMWSSRALMLIESMCELSYKEKYPQSSNLDDLTKFITENQDAVKLKNYLKILPGYKDSLGSNQSTGTYNQHGFVEMNLNGLAEQREQELNDRCTINHLGKYTLRTDQDGSYLDVVFNDYTVQIEKRNEFLQKTFRVNDTLVDDIELHNLVNIISYTQFTKNITKENIEAVYYLLR